MPPSMNKLYIRRRGGRVALSDAAHRYREHAKQVVTRQLAAVSAFPAEDPEIIFGIDITAYFNELENPGWFETFQRGKSQGERKAKTRYKKVDADNRIKFAQDCLVKSLGIPDDAQVFEVTIRKMKQPVKDAGEVLCMRIRTEERRRFFD